MIYEKKLTDIISVYARLTESIHTRYVWGKDTEEFRVQSIMLTMVMVLFTHEAAHDWVILTGQDIENLMNTITRYAHKIAADDQVQAFVTAINIANEFTEALGLDTDNLLSALANS